MKRRRPDIDRAMGVSRFAKVDVADLPLHFGRGRANPFQPQTGAAERHHDIVIAMHMPERRIACGHRHIEHPHKFIFKLRVMTRLAANFDW